MLQLQPLTALLVTFILLMLGAAIVYRLTHPLDAISLAPRATGYFVPLNSADTPTLALLPGIGINLAERIVAHRQQHGPFASVDQLTNVPGVGEKTVERIRPFVTCEKK